MNEQGKSNNQAPETAIPLELAAELQQVDNSTDNAKKTTIGCEISSNISDTLNTPNEQRVTEDEIQLTEEEKAAIAAKTSAEIKKIMSSIPMKRQQLKFALREMCKESDMLILYSEPTSREKGIFYLGRLMVIHPEGFAVLGPSTEHSPKYAVLSESQLPMMTKMLTENGFAGYSVEKESCMVFIKISGELDPGTGQVRDRGLIIPSSPFKH